MTNNVFWTKKVKTQQQQQQNKKANIKVKVEPLRNKAEFAGHTFSTKSF